MDDETFWKSSSEHAPETRLELSKRSRKSRARDQEEENQKVRKSVSLFAKDGRPLNINQSKLKFNFSIDDPEALVLELHVYK